MANSTLDDSKFILYDRFPGAISLALGMPADGFTGTSHHNVASPVFPIGTKIQVYDTTNKGYATFIYAQYKANTAKVAVNALAAKDFVAMQLTANGATTYATESVWYWMSDAGDVALMQSGLAVAISAMTTDYYGWFWCAGVCPVDFVSGLGGNYVTDSNVAAGAGIVGVQNASATASNGKMIILGISMTGAAHATSVIDKLVCGIALRADAS
jgi:hypothetical protein